VGSWRREAAVQELLLVALLALENDGQEGHAWVQRFFRSHPEHRYVGAVHEQLGPGFEARAEALAAFGVCRTVTGPARIAAPTPGVTTWKSALGIADALTGLGRVDDAVATLQSEIAAGRPEAELPAHAARLLASAGRLGEALTACSDALARDGRAWLVWDLTANLLRRAGRHDVAEQAERNARHWASVTSSAPVAGR